MPGVAAQPTHLMPTLSPELLAKLSPYRTNESNWVMTLLRGVVLHRRYYPNLANSVPVKELAFFPLVSQGEAAWIVGSD
jgi:hypothetical protein